MPRILLAALALACVCSPAMAISLERAIPPYTARFDWSVLWLGVGAAVLALILFGISSRFRDNANLSDSCVLGGAMVGLFVAFPALAETVTVNGQSTVILPWGDYLAALAQASVQIMLPVILPAVAAAIIAALAKVAPWATLFLSQRRLEQMGQALADYGLNAVQGATKGKTLSVDVGSRVIAAGVNYGLEKVPPRVIAKAGGAEGLAKIIFRLISVDEHATASAVIPAALEKIHLPPAAIERPTVSGFPPPTADELRDAERMTRG